MLLKLTNLARKTLESSFEGKRFIPDDKIKTEFKAKKACFVTLTKNGNLRGCVGSIFAQQELWKDVQQNALHSAFDDSRFFPLKKEELKEIKIEVSVLSDMKRLEHKNENDLLKKLAHNMGILLKKGFYEATFLPQVWEQIPDKTEFLEQLSLKAGLNKDAWKTAEILFYTVRAEEE